MAATQKFAPGYAGRDTPSYALDPHGRNGLLWGVQDLNDTDEKPDTPVPQQGFPTARHLSGIEAASGDITLTILDVSQLNLLSGLKDENPSANSLSDMAKVDIVSLHVNPDTKAFTFATFRRGVKFTSRGRRSTTPGPQQWTVNFTADKVTDVEGAIASATGTLTGDTITLPATALSPGPLRISVVIGGVLTDITDNRGTWGSSGRPSWEWGGSDVVTLYGVTTGAYCVWFAKAVPSPYDVKDDYGNPAQVLPS